MENGSELLRLVETVFCQIVGQDLEDEYDIEKVNQFRKELLASPENYSSIIEKKLGRSRKLRLFIEQLKKQPQFLKIIAASQVKPIHKLPLMNLEFGKHTNYIFTLPINSQIEWNLENIIHENKTQEQAMIENIIKNSESLANFFYLIEDYFVDFCIRKLDVAEVVGSVNTIALQVKQVDAQLRKVLIELTCPDFIRIFARFYNQKPYLGIILHRLSIPIPFLFVTKAVAGQIEITQPDLLNSVTRVNDYCLITNIGSTKMIGKGKTSFLQKMFMLKKRYLSHNQSNFHDGSVDFYTKIPAKIKGKNILIADFHSDYCRTNQKYRELLQQCISHSTVVFVHLNEDEVTLGNDVSPLFKKEYQSNLVNLLKDTEGEVLYVLRDCRNFDNDDFITTIGGLNCITMPNLTLQQQGAIANIKSKCSNLYTHLQKLQPKPEVKIDSSLFLSTQNLQEFQVAKAEVEQIMLILIQLFHKQHFYEAMFPNLNDQLKKLIIKQEIGKYENQLNREIEDEKCLREYNEAKTRLDKLNADPPKKFSLLISAALALLQNKFHMMHLLADSLSAWRSKQTEQFIKFIIAKNAAFDSMNRNQNMKKEIKEQLRFVIKDAEQRLQTYDISIDTIFSEMIAAMQRDPSKYGLKERDLIKRYYKESYESITPINLIEGKTLQFGNLFLEQFIDELYDTKYNNKDIFVVSVVGAQSSAKSTILNYIFRCNFATSVGRCTKGVYFTIVECDEKVIIVVDTEGLLSVAARNHTFDVQIACFVMLISDLVIINNRGEVDTMLRDLLGVCVYAIHELNSSEADVPYQANRVIFTIRDQIEYGGTRQKQMLSQIIKSLNENSKIQYSKYINFTDQDIFPLQSAFNMLNEGVFCLEEANNSFGKSVLSLRGRIIAMLKNPKNSSLTQFYANSKRRWESIQNCGENIFNFKSIYEIKTTEYIKEILEKLKKAQRKLLTSKQEEIVSMYLNRELQKQIQIEGELKNHYLRSKQDMVEEFHRICEQKVKEKELVKNFDFEIDEFCTIRYREFMGKFKKRLLDIRFMEENNSYKKSIRDTLAKCYAKGKKDNEILQDLERQTANLGHTLNEEMLSLETKRVSAGRNELSHHITKIVDLFLRNFYVESKIQYHNLEALQTEYSRVQLHKARRSKELLNVFQAGNNKFGEDKKQLQEIIGLLCNFLNECEKSVNALIKFEFNANIEAIEPLMAKIMQQINQDFDILIEQLDNCTKKHKLPRFELKHRGVVLARFISTFPLKFEKTYYEMAKFNLEKKFNERQQAILELTAEVKESLKIRGNTKQTAKLWIKKILNRELSRFFEYSQQIIQQQLEEICSFLNPKDIQLIAMKDSFRLSKVRNKQRWFNCYKIIKNTNRFLKEILFEQSEYRDLDQKIKNAKNTIAHRINKYIETKMVDEIQSTISIQMGSTILPSEDNCLNVEYYEKAFGIDLAPFKNDEIQQRLDEILICMCSCIEDIKIDRTQLQFYKQYGAMQLEEHLLKLKNDLDNFIKERVEPIVIGCQARCPGCGMKCFKTGGHIDGHALLGGAHVMQCFSGRVYDENGSRSSDLCFTQQNIWEKYIKTTVEGQTKTIPVIEWIKQKHPDWHEHFLSKPPPEDNKRKKECNMIWANIEYVIIKYKYPYMLPDQANWKYQYDQLDEEDIIANNLEDY